MADKYYLVTNRGDGALHIAGRRPFDIPAKCQDLLIRLPESVASQTVARLKQQYPTLDIRPSDKPAQTKATPQAKAEAKSNAVATVETKAEEKTAANAKTETQTQKK